MALLGALTVLLLDAPGRGHVLGVAQRRLLHRLARLARDELLPVRHAGDVDLRMELALTRLRDAEVAATFFVGRVELELPGGAAVLEQLRRVHRLRR
jgi:hypothetical protein